MKSWGLRAAFRCMAAGLMAGVIGSGAFAAGDAYDFDYRISGHTSARPVQVFADTERTYFQFVSGQPVPLILAGEAGERVVPVQEGPYHVVAGRSREYTLRLAGRQARVEHAGKVWRSSPPQGTGPSVPLKLGADDRTLSSYATPVRGDVIEWVESEQQVVHSVVFAPGTSLLPDADADFLAKVSARMGADVRVEVRREGGSRSRALAEARFRRTVQALVRAGVAPERIESAAASHRSRHDVLQIVWRRPVEPVRKTSSSGAPPSPDVASMGRPVRGNFDILLSDGTVSTSLRRWAQASGYRLEWETPIEAPVVGEMTLDTRRFPDAVDRIVTGLRASGYPLRMETGDGQVVRIQHEPPR